MTRITFAALFPELLNENGDSENAAVLSARAGWSGVAAETVAIAADAPWPTERPAVLVLGSGVDAALPHAAAALDLERDRLADWLAAGTRLLAIGTGMELLIDTVVTSTATIDGLGLLAGSIEELGARASGDLVVDAPEGRLVGFENHSRRIAFADDLDALGTVVSGVGEGNGREGVRTASILGTRLHGPVMALNPALADQLLTEALGERYSAETEAARQVDGYAASARDAIVRSLKR